MATEHDDYFKRWCGAGRGDGDYNDDSKALEAFGFAAAGLFTREKSLTQ